MTARLIIASTRGGHDVEFTDVTEISEATLVKWKERMTPEERAEVEKAKLEGFSVPQQAMKAVTLGDTARAHQIMWG